MQQGVNKPGKLGKNLATAQLQNIHYKSQNGCQISITVTAYEKADATVTEKKKKDQISSAVCQALKKKARQILSQKTKQNKTKQKHIV